MTARKRNNRTEPETDKVAPDEFFIVFDKATKNYSKFRANGDKLFEDFERGYYIPSSNEAFASAKRLRITIEVVE